MNIDVVNPKRSLNKAYLKEKVSRSNIELLKKNLATLLSKINEHESEEHHKNLITEFLKDTWYKDLNEINTKGRSDLVIHTGKTSKDPVGVIIETKKPSNKSEMISEAKPNTKAMHELVLYYLRERIDHANINITHLIITNVYEWCIVDENWFETNVYRNPKLRKDYENWKLSGKDTKFFYESIAQPYLSQLNESFSFTYFDLRDYRQYITAGERENDNKLIPLYKIFSPAHLFKQSFKNDNNTLDKKFYRELLHILGLDEVKQKSKTLIQRKDNPDEASLLENTINKLKSRDSLGNVTNLTAYGTVQKDQLYHIGLELCITWINRIIFIKLLEAQLFRYHHNDSSFLFLNIGKIFDFGELSNVFFDVLAEKPSERLSQLKGKFEKVPYLNSSLFERTALEKQALDIGNLDNRVELPLYHDSVLKDIKGKKKTGDLPTLQYLFEFLDSYDFSSEGSEEIQEENKNLINAAVLGLIFEKINGYKDGAFFTPGFVTMYMCKETIRKSVVQKFNTRYDLDCNTFQDLKNYLAPHFKAKDLFEYNNIVNDLKLCDPAVGSGHYLVSALNEIISIKSELGILIDIDGYRLNGYDVRIESDELIITYNENSEIFEYTIKNNVVSKDIQRVQKTIFHEKETIIENSLFGVDLNPNSVKICRLRLWIELLKSAYYTDESGFSELETLPNIDINIKCGNSLISRFSLEDDLHSSFEGTKYSFHQYKEAVQAYKHTRDKETKKAITTILEDVKSSFSSSLNEKFKKLIAKARGKLTNVSSEINRKKEWQEAITDKMAERLRKAKKSLEIAEKVKDDILSNAIYKDSFEWRFEFPEVLDENQNFIGFDAVIGNPPYIPLEDLTPEERDFYRNKYPQFGRKFETSVLFMTEGFKILRPEGYLSYIAPVTWQTGENYSAFRKYLSESKGVDKIINLPFDIFADAYVETAIYLFSNHQLPTYCIYSYDKKDVVSSFEGIKFDIIDASLLIPPKYKIILNPFVAKFLKELDVEYAPLGDITISTQGLSGSMFKPSKKADPNRDFPFLVKGNVYNYQLQIEETYLVSLDDKASLKPFYESGPKLLIRRIINRQDRLSVGYTENKMVFKKDINPFVPSDNRFHPKYLLTLMASRLISYVYLEISTIAKKDDFRQTTLGELRELPMPILSKEKQRPFIILADYLLVLASLGESTSFFDRVADALVYELFLPSIIKQANCKVSPFLLNLPELDKKDPKKNLILIQNEQKALSSPSHPITASLLKLLNIAEINKIEGRS